MTDHHPHPPPADDPEPLPADFADTPCGGWCLGDCPGCLRLLAPRL